MICFIIAHKYYRGHTSFLHHYVENIKKFYENALIIIVDNNSEYPEDIFDSLRDSENVVLLSNNIECKFELGAYQVGLKYVIDNDLIDAYSHFVCTQENFVIKNKYDFDTETRYAFPINSMWKGGDGYAPDVTTKVLGNIGLQDDLVTEADFCWCSSFVVKNSKITQLYEYLQAIVQTTRYESEAAERYLGRILYELNDRVSCGDIDGSCKDLHLRHYDCWDPNIYKPVTSFFRKHVQQRNEHTRDL